MSGCLDTHLGRLRGCNIGQMSFYLCSTRQLLDTSNRSGTEAGCFCVVVQVRRRVRALYSCECLGVTFLPSLVRTLPAPGADPNLEHAAQPWPQQLRHCQPPQTTTRCFIALRLIVTHFTEVHRGPLRSTTQARFRLRQH